MSETGHELVSITCTWDAQARAFYIPLLPTRELKSTREEPNAQVLIDRNEAGEIVGVEVLLPTEAAP